jgi:competence protein ComEA
MDGQQYGDGGYTSEGTPHSLPGSETGGAENLDEALARLQAARKPLWHDDVTGHSGDDVAPAPGIAHLTNRQLPARHHSDLGRRQLALAYAAAAQGHLPGGDSRELAHGSQRARIRLAPRIAAVAVGTLLALGLGIGLVTYLGGADGGPTMTTIDDGHEASASPSSPEPSAADTDADLPITGAGGGSSESGEGRPGNKSADGGLPAGGAVAPSGDSPDGGDAAGTKTIQGLVVHVVGQVATPGLVRLPVGARVGEAIQAAGGPTGEADLAAINLARLLVDGEQVLVPKPGQQPNPEPAAGTGNPAAGAPAPTGASLEGKVNINAADVTGLQRLPGIGPSLAQRIIDWRDNNGRFASVDELSQVTGIGAAKLAALRAQATV